MRHKVDVVALAVGLMPMADLVQMLQVETVYIPSWVALYRGMTSWVTRLIQAFMCWRCRRY